MKWLREMFTCTKTKAISSTRVLVVLGCLVCYFCIIFLVVRIDDRLNGALPILAGIIVALITGKVMQSKNE